MKEEISILIPSRFNSRYIIELCLLTIRKYTDYPYRIVIGNAGLDEETSSFLYSQGDIKMLDCPDPLRPKDTLAKSVDTPFFIFLHDDVQILRKGWLNRRVEVMESFPKVGALGVLAYNYLYGLKSQLSLFSPLNKRFFPLAMLVRKQAQDELDLHWGKITGFDTGAIAYFQFARQNKWKFYKYGFKNDIRHWGGMTWILRKKLLKEQAQIDMDKFLTERNKKIEIIKDIIIKKQY